MHSSICLVILIYCITLLLCHSYSAPTTTTIKGPNEIDRVALLAIKSLLHDPAGVTISWNNSIPFCLWTGVTCGHRHQRVTKLDLSNQKIGGRLSPFIGNLSFLRCIDLKDNNFYGEIPSEISRLFRLQHLILSNNSFSGMIPTNLPHCSNFIQFNALQNLRLSNNSFSGMIPTNLSHCSNLIQFIANKNSLIGEIPAEFSYLLNLEILDVGYNHITGQIPAFIGNLTALHLIDVMENRLSGKIPDTIGHLTGLFELNLALNNLSGIIPISIYNITSLEKLFLLSNRLSGSLPPEIGNNLPNLKIFTVAINKFTGSLPNSLSNASNLVKLDLAENYFRGEVSIDFGSIKNLSKLHLGKNSLGTRTANDLEFVTSLINCSKLEVLALYENQFGGILPHSIANFSTTMTRIAIGENQISGTIPAGIRNLVGLTGLTMESNRLIGTIPPVIGELKNLQLLYLNENNLQGTIPSSLGNLTILTLLRLESNNLHGNIPSSIGNCQNLIDLTFSHNKLTGSVPQLILGITTLSLYLDLSDNLLSGPFPSEVGNLKNLIALDISGNQFSSEVPFTLGDCTSLEILYIDHNSFNGTIPFSLNSLRSIQWLDLSSNNLSGQIPKFLEKLSFLEHLNLSCNHFEGEVPTKGVFSNITVVPLDGNEKLCGGLAELHLPPCHHTKADHLKLLIPVIVVCMILSLAFFFIITRRRNSGQKHTQMSRMEEQFPMISYAALRKATNEFSPLNVIGQGSHGLVYKGILGENRKLVAVKVFKLQQAGAFKSFIAECGALKNIRHRNLIKIITTCSSIDIEGADFKALVYEYMQNGSLEAWLHHHRDQYEGRSLSLIEGLDIVIDVASAMEYLHHYCQPPIIHGDLKPSNVLLDQEMVAHVCDFGLAKFLSDCPLITDQEAQLSSIGIKGTVGYVAPEYGLYNEFSMSGDVYSFGILLLEMFTRKRPIDNMFTNGLTLHEFSKRALPERVMGVVEPSMLLEVGAGNSNAESFRRQGQGRKRIEECLSAILRIGVLCSVESPAERIEMTEAVAKLCAIRDKLLSSKI